MVCCTPPARLHDAHRVADRLDADLVDRELARIVRGLDVGNVVQVFGFHGRHYNSRLNYSGIADANRFLDAFGVQPYRRQEFGRVAMVDEAVRQSQQQRPGIRLRKHFQHGAARPAHDLVLFDGDDQLVRRREPRHQVGVDRLHEAHVGDRRVEFLRGLERRLHHRAEREDGDLLAVRVFDFAFADRECKKTPSARQHPGPCRADTGPPPAHRSGTR